MPQNDFRMERRRKKTRCSQRAPTRSIPWLVQECSVILKILEATQEYALIFVILQGMAFAMRQCGFILGLISFLVVAGMMDLSLRLLIKAGENSGATSYQDLMSKSLGKTGFVLVSVMQFAYPFCSA